MSSKNTRPKFLLAAAGLITTRCKCNQKVCFIIDQESSMKTLHLVSNNNSSTLLLILHALVRFVAICAEGASSNDTVKHFRTVQCIYHGRVRY